MKLWTLDFETFFSNEYSLTRHEYTTESYVRSPLFKAHGCSVRDPTGVYFWVTHSDLERFFASLDWSQVFLLCHHMQFDGLILSHHYGRVPAMYACTKAMGNLILPNASKRLDSLADHFGLPRKFVPYNLFKGIRDLPPVIEQQVADGAIHDARLNYEIFTRMLRGDPERNMPPFPSSELPIVDATIRMFTVPRLVMDVPRATTLADQAAQDKDDILDKLGVEREVLASRDCFADLLRELGVEPPMKPAHGKTAKPGEITYAFAKNDPAMQELLASDDPDIAALAAAKLEMSSTIGETRARRMAGIGSRGLSTLYINYAAAHTGRPGGSDKTNFLNMPRDGKLRSCLQAPPGYRLIVVDENAIECRLVNALAGNWGLVELFRQGADVYALLATSIFGFPVDKDAFPLERFIGKTVELGSGYGLSWKTYQYKMATGSMGGKVVRRTDLEAQNDIGTYRRTHDPVVRYWDQGKWALHMLYEGQTVQWGPMLIDKGWIVLPNGTPLNYTTLHQRPGDYGLDFWVTRRNGSSRVHGPKTVENVTQALAWTITSDAIRVLRKEMDILLAPYDEIVALAPEAEADRYLQRVIDVMSRPVTWLPELPIKAEGAHMERYAKP